MLLWEPILWDRYATVMSSTDSTILTCRRAHCSGTWFFLRHSHAALTEWGLYPHRSTDTRTSDPEIPRQARTHQLAPPSKETLRESESRAAFGLLFGAESVIQSRHMLHMGVKCRFMLHKVRMYEGPQKASFMKQIGSICIFHILPMPSSAPPANNRDSQPAVDTSGESPACSRILSECHIMKCLRGFMYWHFRVECMSR